MQLRDLKLSDLVILEKDNLPNLFNGPFKLRKTILSEEDEVLGACWVRVTAEISLLLRENISSFKKARAINNIGEFLYNEIPLSLGISEALITFDGDFDESYINSLKKHFNFQEIRALRTRRNDG
jgi:hypothetical protein